MNDRVLHDDREPEAVAMVAPRHFDGQAGPSSLRREEVIGPEMVALGAALWQQMDPQLRVVHVQMRGRIVTVTASMSPTSSAHELKFLRSFRPSAVAGFIDGAVASFPATPIEIGGPRIVDDAAAEDLAAMKFVAEGTGSTD